MRGVPIEYYVLAHVREDGPILCYLAGHPVSGWIRDHWGKRYRYAGLAPRCTNGAFDVKLLLPGEWIVQPGLIYAAADGEPGE
ncbi:MAG: hypothetical protein GC186_20665 [Rhodobacteraceae bacterium]|nr:hypothetical protein [Paracoccaceae bacterium]